MHTLFTAVRVALRERCDASFHYRDVREFKIFYLAAVSSNKNALMFIEYCLGHFLRQDNSLDELLRLK